MIDIVRTYIGYREYPKYGMVSRYFIYKQALLAEADRLVEPACSATGRTSSTSGSRSYEDVRTPAGRPPADREREGVRVVPAVLAAPGADLRRRGFAGTYRRDDLPAGALVGLPVSAGTVEGRARVVSDLARGRPEAGDILVTAYTDPSWTPVSSRSGAS